jgi:RNA polymerase sigma-70 factor, ECF subfamily
MVDVAIRTRADTTDEAVRDALLAGFPSARRLATYILRDPSAAEDAVQEAALLAWDRRRSLRDIDAAEAWFSRILVNVCRGELRRASRKRYLVEIDPGCEDGREALDRRDELGRAIRRLDPDEQVLLGLRYGRDLTVPQMAAVTGAREGTVKSRLHAAHEHLRAILDSDRRLEEALR